MIDILQYEFMRYAFAAGILVAIAAPLLGVFLTVRRQSLMADTLAHASLAGVAIGVLLDINPLAAALAATLVAALVLEHLRNEGKVASDALLALVLSGSLAFAVVAMSAAGSFNASILQYLFGGITTVTSQDLVIMAAVTVAVVAGITIFFRQYFLIAFDENVARAQGLKVTALNILFALLTGATIAIGMRVVGVLLIGALMVVPVLAASRLGLGFRSTTITALGFALASVITGLTVSYYFDLASGGTIVLAALVVFLICSLFAKK